MKKLIINSIVIISFIFLLTTNYTYAKDNTPKSVNAQNITDNIENIINKDNEHQDYSKYYKITKQNDFLSCIYPQFVDTLNQVYLRNKNNEVVYIISMKSVSGDCSWQADKFLFKTNTPNFIVNEVMKQHDKNLYFVTNSKIIFEIKKIRSKDTLAIKTIKVPYFVIFNDKTTNNILLQSTKYITMQLPKSGTKTYTTDNIKITTHFKEKDFLKYEILTGIYL